MEVDPQRLFRFRFKSPGASDNMAYFVLTDDIEKMKLFLKQHNFDPVTSFVDCVMLKDHESDSEFMLEPFILKSNYSTKTYTIMSNEHMIYECANEVASIMSQSSIFGPTIIREDIPIMKVISELIQELDYTYVLDHTVCDSSTGKPYSSAYEQYTKVGFPSVEYSSAWLNLSHEPAAYDDSALYEAITSAVGKGYPLPFTLEMYVSYFVGLLTDSYN